MRFVVQHDQRDCGAACLAMIADYYGLKMSISQCRELTGTDKLGTNLYGLVEGAQKIGLSAQALSGSPEELIEGLQKGEITYPFIAHTISEDAMLHFVVVYAMKHGKFLIGDPEKGKLHLVETDFWERWTGYIVSFRKTEAFQSANLSVSKRLTICGFFLL